MLRVEWILSINIWTVCFTDTKVLTIANISLRTFLESSSKHAGQNLKWQNYWPFLKLRILSEYQKYQYILSFKHLHMQGR